MFTIDHTHKTKISGFERIIEYSPSSSEGRATIQVISGDAGNGATAAEILGLDIRQQIKNLRLEGTNHFSCQGNRSN